VTAYPGELLTRTGRRGESMASRTARIRGVDVSYSSALRRHRSRPVVFVVAALVLPVLIAATLPDRASAQAAPGTAIAQLAGTDGCAMQIENDLEHGCARAGGLQDAQGVTLSPDQRFVYVVSGGTLDEGTNGVVAFARDPATGALRPVGCTTANGGDGRVGSEGLCARGDALVGAIDLAFSPDGAHAYVASEGSAGVAWLTRNAVTGQLAPVGCAKDAPRADRCTEVPHLLGASGVAVSPDGRDVYVAAAGSSALHAFARDPATGALTRRQCLSETGSDGACAATPGLQRVVDVTVAPDGRAVYAAGLSGAVVRFARDAATGTLTETACVLERAPAGGPCRDANGIDGANAVAVSPDSRDVYVAASRSEAVTSFRTAADGTLVASSCIQRVPDEDEADTRRLEPGCQGGTSVWQPEAIAVAADGRSVYAAGLDTVTSYRRDPAFGALRQTGCVEEERTAVVCQEGRALNGVTAIAVTSDGRNVYTAAAGNENAVATFGATVGVDAASLTLRRAGTIRVPLRCPRVVARACAGTVALAGPRANGARSFRLQPGTRRALAVAAPRAVRRALRDRATAAVTVRVTDARGVLERLTRRMTVRRG
jgi:6-phosphogluconolactonase (cycloisomerase 2 family)